MKKEKFDELFKKAEQKSKQDFLKFVTGIYGVGESAFDHMWDVPVIPSYRGDILLPICELIDKNVDAEEILGEIDEVIEEELGTSEACFISMDKFLIDMYVGEENLKKMDIVDKKMQNGELPMEYDSIIVYNEAELLKQCKQMEAENNENDENLELQSIKKIASILTHERCHLNANTLFVEYEKVKPDDNNKEKVKKTKEKNGKEEEEEEIVIEHVEEMNGASMNSLEQKEYEEVFIEKRKKCRPETFKAGIKAYEDRNEVLVDTLSLMMSYYEDGDDIQDCLYKVIKPRNGYSRYNKMDDREVLTMYVLFPEQLTEWMTFGAYYDVRDNKYKQLVEKVCGSDKVHSGFITLKGEVENYVKNLEEGSLSDKQKEMLEMLGYSVNKKIAKNEVKELATSKDALKEFEGGLSTVKSITNNLDKGQK